MVCTVQMYETPDLTNPVLIEGLPGIGFVANISALHLIKKLKATLFAEIRSSYFQNFALTGEGGTTRFPINEFYYHKGRNGERDLIILYGNTQALTTIGQYELCGALLDVAEQLRCPYIITLGGLKREETIESPELYCAATNKDSLHDALDLGAKIMGGQIFGIAGLLIGLSNLRGLNGFCLLAETPGLYPDATAARQTLTALCKMLHLKVDLSQLDMAAETTKNILKSFGLTSQPRTERSKKSDLRWLI